MKSIMQEASSVAKAIEKAWISAGKPKEFSVKVFEEAQKNFIGFTTRSAKIALFFNETHAGNEYIEGSRERNNRKNQGQSRYPASQKKQEQPAKRHEKSQPAPAAHDAQGEERVIWTPDMVKKACDWTDNALTAMNLAGVAYDSNIDNYTLNITFKGSLLDNGDNEKQLFKSFSFLMLQALKRTFKRPLRGFKISLSRSL